MSIQDSVIYILVQEMKVINFVIKYIVQIDYLKHLKIIPYSHCCHAKKGKWLLYAC